MRAAVLIVLLLLLAGTGEAQSSYCSALDAAQARAGASNDPAAQGSLGLMLALGAFHDKEECKTDPAKIERLRRAAQLEEQNRQLREILRKLEQLEMERNAGFP